MRARAATGGTGEAVEIRLGEVRQAFQEYDAELLKLAERKQRFFSTGIARGEQALDELWLVLPFAAGGIAVLLGLGVWPRLREYR